MKVVILAGGMGTRIMEESQLRPKPMIEIGGRPILWHIMKLYGHYGFREFVICLGYKGYFIKEYFANFFLHQSDVTIDTERNEFTYHQTAVEPWRVTLVDTGDQTMTGGRLRRVRQYLDRDQPFCFTYGDGLADVDLAKLVAFHRKHRLTATVTAVTPPARYGALELAGDVVERVREKPLGSDGLINGGFFVLEPKAIDLIEGDGTSFEGDTLEKLAAQRQLAAFRHSGFWQAMDTLRDKNVLEEHWKSGRVPWKVWS